MHLRRSRIRSLPAGDGHLVPTYDDVARLLRGVGVQAACVIILPQPSPDGPIRVPDRLPALGSLHGVAVTLALLRCQGG